MRKLAPFEIFPVKGKNWIQLAMKFGSKSEAYDVANMINKKAFGTRLRSDETHLIPLEKSPELVKIPEFPNLIAATEFVKQNYTPSCHQSLGVVTYNDNMVILNSNHSVSDGVYIMELNKFILGESKMEDNHLPVPISFDEAFADYYKSLRGHAIFDTSHYKYTLTKSPQKDTEAASYYTYVIPYEQLKAYNKNTNKIKNVTDNIWASYVLSSAAHNGYLDNYGVFACVNLRPYLPKVTFDYANIFSRKAVAVPMKDRNETLQSVCSRFRKIFDSKQALDDLFRLERDGNFKTVPTGMFNLETSNVGIYKATGPILDIYVSTKIQNAFTANELCFLTYTVDHGKTKELVCQLRHPTHLIATEEVSKLASSTEFFMKNMDLSYKVGDVFDELTKYQKTL
ncbi:hypothetical protein TVAG_416690 [Trichomonas vaginalis G3]|uniref:Uncharacterized protein n=1 Tax=Trichomonas vaginalis (strain ATCC PRA-98 / G3) TaxID=412133 RepID=A2EQR1_TRIV3|nr:hypothetical protein TVAGG3_0894110 [Trichomonas vaginalis G3]EAY05026.1 hypothetical protein TVAG_416690 [Trichomonas vaginalis G3]KAI5502932.1 hypothetical protein TVAGG3_0894110 [Trichomonas vaginalis G3]|eukprot:XP_001317249.1 hypothetical protein [Trichomonas vaginalis G3]